MYYYLYLLIRAPCIVVLGGTSPNSDIDMVIYGSVDEKTINRISTLFNDIYLPLKVDIHAYNLISYQPLKEHIDNKALPFFNAEQIRNLLKIETKS